MNNLPGEWTIVRGPARAGPTPGRRGPSGRRGDTTWLEELPMAGMRLRTFFLLCGLGALVVLPAPAALGQPANASRKKEDRARPPAPTKGGQGDVAELVKGNTTF